MDELEKKKKFAALLLKNGDEELMNLALQIEPDNSSQALKIAFTWPNDPEVLKEKERLLASEPEGELAFLPTKADAAKLAWKLAESGGFVEDRLKALKLFADIRGFIAKPEAGVKVEVTQNKVMVIKDHGTDESWEEKLRKQQKALVENAGENVSRKH